MRYIVILTCFLFLAGCSGRTSSSRSEVIRTDLSQWQTLDVPFQGICYEIPAAAFHSQMHHIPHLMSDSTWMLTVDIDKETAEQRATPWEPAPENPVSKDPGYMAWLKWTHEVHTNTSTSESGNRREYRRDILNTDGSVVRIHIQYVFGLFTPQQQIEDETAIKRIATNDTQQSAAPLPRAPQTGHSEVGR
jgi:hypothetical protein